MPVDSLSQLPMEQIAQIFGITIEQIALVAGIVFFVVEFLKGKFPKFIKGIVTDISAVVIGLGISIAIAHPNWAHIIALTGAAWMFPAGAHKMVNRLFGRNGK